MNRLHSRLRMRNGAGWNPLMLFSGGEQGVIYDPNDLNSLFQDSAGTIPVTAAGQPVGRMLDKSGRGNHAFQPTAASRPILRLNATTGAYYLETDGVDDFMSTAAIDFTATDKVSVFAGVRKLSQSAEQILCEFGITYSIAGAFSLNAVRSAVNVNFSTFVGIAAGGSSYEFTGEPPVPNSYAVSATYDRGATPAMSGRRNGSAIGSGGAAVGGSFGNYSLYLFRRGGTTIPFNGHFYGLIIVGRLASTTEITNVERIFANKTGVTLA